MTDCRHTLTLYEAEGSGYHEHWLAASSSDAARRALAHARERRLTLDRVRVSSMVRPEDPGRGGLVYVVNDTRTSATGAGRRVVRLVRPPASGNPRKGPRP